MMIVCVENRAIGAIVGKDGKTIKLLMAHTDTVIQISPKNVYLPGTTQREIKVIGVMENLHTVYNIIVETVSAVLNQPQRWQHLGQEHQRNPNPELMYDSMMPTHQQSAMYYQQGAYIPVYPGQQKQQQQQFATNPQFRAQHHYEHQVQQYGETPNLGDGIAVPQPNQYVHRNDKYMNQNEGAGRQEQRVSQIAGLKRNTPKQLVCGVPEKETLAGSPLGSGSAGTNDSTDTE